LPDLNKDLVLRAEYDSETKFNDLDLDTFTNDLLDDNDWSRAVHTQDINLDFRVED